MSAIRPTGTGSQEQLIPDNFFDEDRFPRLIEKICQLFVETIAWFVGLVKTYVFCMPRATAVQQQSTQTQMQTQAAQQPSHTDFLQQDSQEGRTQIPGKIEGTLSLKPDAYDVFGGHNAIQFVDEFWKAEGAGVLERSKVPNIIDDSLWRTIENIDSVQSVNDFSHIKEIPIDPRRTLQEHMANLTSRDSNRTALILSYSNCSHVLLFDCRKATKMIFSHYNLHARPAYLQTFEDRTAFAAYLDDTILSSSSSYILKAYRPRAGV